jgi:hypothetical protein
LCAVVVVCITAASCDLEPNDGRIRHRGERSIIRLASELQPEWVTEFPDIEAIPDPDIEVISLMGLAWRVMDYESPDLEGPSPVYGGPARAVYHTAPPSLAIHAIVPSPACLVSPWIRVSPSSNYSLIGRVRTENLVASGPIRGTFYLEVSSESGIVPYAFPNRDGSSHGWERELFSFVTSSEADKLRVSACLAGPGGGTGSAWFDDVALVRHEGPGLSSELVDRLVDELLSFQWRYDVAEAVRPKLGRDRGWGDESEVLTLRRKIDLGGEVLTALVAPTPTRYRFPVDLEPGTRMRLAFGIPNPDGVEIPGSVFFSVAFEPDGQEAVLLLERELRLTDPDDPNHWHHVERMLPASGPGYLVLSTDATPQLKLAAAAFGNPVLLPPASARKGRRVILISLDTLRADRLGVYGAELPTSPNLDALATRGVVFENAQAPAPWTLPSHRTLLTGLQPLTHGALIGNRHSLRSEITTLGEILQGEGFSTVGIHGGGFVAAAYGFAEGFDRYDQIEQLDDGVDAAIDVLLSDADQDLFLFLHSYQVHGPYLEEEADLAALGTRYFELRQQLRDLIRPRELGSHDYLTRRSLSGEALPPGQLEMVKLLYDGGLRSADRKLSRLFTALDESGQLDEALIVVTSDHGDGFEEHGLLLHANSLYRELLHVPLIWVGPGVPAGVRVEQPVGSADVAPTLLELLGIDVPAELDGRSLVSLWKNPETAPEPIAGSLVQEGSALLSSLIDDSKYIVSSSARSEELYDLREDALEATDISSQHPDRLAAHRRQMLPRIARLPGLHLVVIGDPDGNGRSNDRGPTGSLEGSITFVDTAGPARTFFVACEACVRVEDSRLALSLPLRPGPQWINLPEVTDIAEARFDLSIGGQPVDALQGGRDRAELLTAEPAPGLYVFVTGGGELTPTELSPDHIEQLEALGYLQ